MVIRISKIILLILIIHVKAFSVLADEILVAVAANMQFAFEEIRMDYERDNNVSVKSVYGSSGKLATQIKNGAPFDIFLSANMSYPEILFKEGFSVNDPSIYAYGKLAVCSDKNLDFNIFENFKSSEVKSIAIADPLLAPYGEEAVKMFKKSGIYPDIKEKIILGTSISQVNHFLHIGSVDVGLTSKSSYVSNPVISGHCIDVSEDMYEPIEQGVVVIKNENSKIKKEIMEFYDYIFQKKAKDILIKYGYGVLL